MPGSNLVPSAAAAAAVVAVVAVAAVAAVAALKFTFLRTFHQAAIWASGEGGGLLAEGTRFDPGSFS